MAIELSGLASYATRKFLGVVGGTMFWADAPEDIAFYGGSLATAISTIGATKTTLRISSPITLSANTTVPNNITLEFANDALITINTGAILTINSMLNAGNRQLFTGAGTVRFGNGAVLNLNTAWRAGNAENADITLALNELIASAEYGKAVCNIYISQAAPVTDGGHDLDNVNSVNFFGNGNSPDGASGYGTSLKLKTGTSATYMFKVGEYRSAIRWKDITLFANGEVAEGVVFEGTSASGTTSIDFSFTNVTLQGFTKGFYHHSLGADWQLAQVGFYQCVFINNASAFVANSVNGLYKFVNPFFSIPEYGIGLDIASSGIISMDAYEFAGALHTKTFTSGNVTTGTDNVNISAHGFLNLEEVTLTTTGAKPTTSPVNRLNPIVYIVYVDANNIKFSSTADGLTVINMTSGGTGTHTITRRSAKVCVIGGSHGTINFIAGQDEGCLTFVENNGSDIDGIINVDKSNIQSKFQLNESCQVNVTQSTLMCHAFQGAPSYAPVSVKDCNVRNISVNDSQVVSPLNLSQMTGGGVLVTENISVAGKFTQRCPQRFFSPATFEGNPTTPIVAIGHDSTEDKYGLFLGRTDSLGDPLYGYFLQRVYATGRELVIGNQNGNRGWDFMNMDVTANVFIGSVVTPAQITANQNNYTPDETNLDRQVETFRLSTDASRNVTGLAMGQIANQSHYIVNAGSFNIVLKHQDTNSTAANRFLCSTGFDITLYPNETALLKYDATVLRFLVYKIGGFLSPEINAQTGTTYTLLVSDNGKVVTLDNASAITVTVPSGLGARFNCVLIQKGAGQVTLTASSTTINNRQSHLKTAGQHAMVTLVSDVANNFYFAGDTAV